MCRASLMNSAIQDSKSEPPLPTANTPADSSPLRATKSTDYLEDIDPRFHEPPMPMPPVRTPRLQTQNRQFRSLSNPNSPAVYGRPDILGNQDLFRAPPPYEMNRARPPPQRDLFNRNNGPLRAPPPVGYEPRRNYSLDSLQLNEGQRSPATSDASHFTSISQRGINPNWRPGFASNSPLSSPQNTRRRKSSREQVVLDSNPDFMLPPERSVYGSRRTRGRGRGNSRSLPGNRRTSSLPRGGSQLPEDSFGFSGMVRDGRYPAPV
jgi:hypothetical protein